MNKYILLLGVAAVSIGSYAAYAGNSATMTVTATIAHDVSLTKTGDINLGTITINPAYTGDTTRWGYSESGAISYTNQGAIVSAPNATVGTFTANIPNPTACNSGHWTCGGLFLNSPGFSFLGESGSDNGCSFYIKYSGSGNAFKVVPNDCYIRNVDLATTGSYSGTLTISYTPG
ncbi:MAG: hypothetical protein IJ689_02780 [Alphaproteobacteria bacterium]|nr:hypothetical protein [Alphaproteobacteria bacterium]